MATIDFTDSIYDAQQGSQNAIRFIYDNTIQLFYKEANAFLRDKRAADIAIRDAYIFIFDHLNSLEDTSKFLLWANEVCKNTCISMLSDAGVFEERVPAEAINLGEISAASDYDAQINMSANMSPDYIQECLEAVLSSLPDNQRACAILWGEGYPIRSISRKLGISPVAVNYTLAYTLGNITNSVNALSANGLPLYAMEPIPYFLWLLMCYYQYYQPGEMVPGSESSFSNILRVLMPGEASVYSGEYAGPDYYSDGRVKQVTRHTQENAGSADDDFRDFTGEELDISAFIVPDTKEKEVPVPEEETETPAPEMEVFQPHADADGESAEQAEGSEDTEKKEESSTKEGSDGSDSGTAESNPESTGDAAPSEQKEDTDKEEGAEASSAPDTAGSDQSSAEKAAVLSAADDKTAAVQKGQPSGDETVSRVNDSMVDDILFGASSMTDASEVKPPRKHTGLIVTLIVIIAILCLLIAAMFLFKDQVNKILGTNLFNTTQVTEPQTTVPEPATPEPTTPEPTTPEPTTPEPTTPEPTTEPETVDPGPEFDVTINLGDSALAMHATPTNDNERLLYIPAGEQVHISEVQDGWGRTTYDGETGWIWLEYTKVAGNARVQEPEAGTMLEQPEPYVMGLTEFGNELRTMPGSYCASFGPIPEGTEIMVEAYYEDTWAHSMYAYTSYDGHHGWVYLYPTQESPDAEQNN